MAKMMSITNARKVIYQISEDVNELHEEILVYNANTGKNMVIISEDDWNSIKETLHLYSVPGLVESILEASREPLSEGKVYDPDEEW